MKLSEAKLLRAKDRVVWVNYEAQLGPWEGTVISPRLNTQDSKDHFEIEWDDETEPNDCYSFDKEDEPIYFINYLTLVERKSRG